MQLFVHTVAGETVAVGVPAGASVAAFKALLEVRPWAARHASPCHGARRSHSSG